MMSFIKFLKRNFGHVYLHDAFNPGMLFRVRARRGKVALIWVGDPFVCRLAKNGELVIDEKHLCGYGKPYHGWTWRYFVPMGFPLENIKDGGAWK